MSSVAAFHIAVEFWGTVISIIGFFGTYFLLQKSLFRTNKLIIQFFCILLLINDMLAWSFNGQSGEFAANTVRITNFIAYLCDFIFISLFGHFLWSYIDPSVTPKRLIIVYLFSIIGVIGTIINQFYPFLFYYDANNIYHRLKAFPLIYVLAVFALFLLFTLLMQNRKKITTFRLFSMIMYFVLPLAAMVILLINPNISLQNVAIVVATQFVLVIDVLDTRDKMLNNQIALKKSIHEKNLDSMTGLWNKASALQQIQNYLDSMDYNDISYFIFIDIDDFKSLNDNYGHLSGDYWIKEVANLLVSLCRKDDIVARFGGDEFVILLKGNPIGDAVKAKMNKFNQLLHDKSSQLGQDVHCSVGICQIIGNGYKVEECIQVADSALYEVKRNGKNTCILFQLSGHEIIHKEEVDSNKVQVEINNEKVNNNMISIFDFVMVYYSDSEMIEVLKCDAILFKELIGIATYDGYIDKIMDYFNVKNERAIQFFDLNRIQKQENKNEKLLFEDNSGVHIIANTIKNPQEPTQYILTITKVIRQQ